MSSDPDLSLIDGEQMQDIALKNCRLHKAGIRNMLFQDTRASITGFLQLLSRQVFHTLKAWNTDLQTLHARKWLMCEVKFVAAVNTVLLVAVPPSKDQQVRQHWWKALWTELAQGNGSVVIWIQRVHVKDQRDIFKDRGQALRVLPQGCSRNLLKAAAVGEPPQSLLQKTSDMHQSQAN